MSTDPSKLAFHGGWEYAPAPESTDHITVDDQYGLFIGGDFGEGTTTDSGYPRTYRIWQRGEPLEEATEIFAGEQTDVAVGVYRFYDADTAWDIAVRTMTFYTSTHYVYDDGDLHRALRSPAGYRRHRRLYMRSAGGSACADDAQAYSW